MIKTSLCVAFTLLLIPTILPAQGNQDAKLKPANFTKAQLQSAEKLIQELFHEELANAEKNPEARRQLAITLLNQAKRIHDDPEVRYAALRKAIDLSADAADTKTAFVAIEELSHHHLLEVSELQIEVLNKAVARAEGEVLKKLGDLGLQLANSASDQDDFVRARKFAELAEKAARDAGHESLLQEIRQRQKELQAAFVEAGRVQTYLAKLKSDPDDGNANLQLGKSWCLVRDRWEKGLPFLLKGSDPVLKELAKMELENPRGGVQQAKLAEGWWQAARKETGEDQLRMLRRSYQWYQQAVFLVNGDLAKKAQDRLSALKKTLPSRLRVTAITVELRQLTGHQGEVLDVAFAPNPRYAASAGADQTVRLWDVISGTNLKTLKGHVGTVFSVSFTPDGKQIVSCGEDKTVRLWDVKTGEELHQFKGARDILNGVAVSPDGKLVAAAGGDKIVYLWELHSGKKVNQLTGHLGMVFKVLFSPDGKMLATSSEDQTIRLWNVQTGKIEKVLNGHQGQVLGLAFAPDGKEILSCGEDRTIRLWEVKTGKEIRSYKGHRGVVGSVAFSPDGSRFLSASDDRTIRLWEVESGQEINRLPGHADAVYRVVFSPDGRLALSCSLDKTLRLWGERH